ncbi:MULTISPECIES: acyl-CoA dehydrogenase family protein [unclassified Nocardioides]|uniref:acyl-CoA dehydrogenase family protein n=1 Tax=unclassified Nocardioides TaxID=2615069 RepID=UPI0006FF7167|nr:MULTISPECIES: acyl-CoA dehydrogenase family protein [unclassified Nocardioides]KRA38888.1 acyl-CoA dehydrogenase [Nocardioides sp. Root614]KRA92848.1 acyl-CoA dehydrogenase [Nocardioides sp. Root682]
MDFNLPETALAVQDGVRAVAAKYDNAYWSECEEAHRFPIEVFNDLGKGGWFGLNIPEEYGGGGQGLLEVAIANEALCASGGGAGTFFYVTTPGFGATTLVRHGTDEQKAEILPGIASGDVQFCFALTEPDAGSNALEIKTSARRDGDDFVIKGQKVWISNVENADWMIAVTRTVPAADAKPRTHGFTLFLIDVKEALAAGTLTYTPIPKMGSNILFSSQVYFDDVRVPARNVIGEVDAGFMVLWDVLNPERILAAAGGVGAADAALAYAAKYACEREVFGRPIGANQGIQFPLAQIKAKTELGRLMAYKAAWLFDQGLPCGNEANVAKLTGAQVAWEAADQAFQTLGGMAYSKEFPVERWLRDARIGKNIPVAEQLVLAHIGTSMLGLPKSY